MPSSTFNSDQPVPERDVPDGPWLRTWLAALAVTAASLGALETFWRISGQRPSVELNNEHWSFERRRVAAHPETAVVLLGSSRMQLGFSLDACRQVWPDRVPIQLAVNGRLPLPTLRHLARDESFRGTVICSVLVDPPFTDTQQEQVDYSDRRSTFNGRLNARLGGLVQSQVALVNPRLGARQVAERLVSGQGLPPPNYLVEHLDRSIDADFSRYDPATHRYDTPPPRYHTDLIAHKAEVIELVGRIHARGGRVVFVHMPIRRVTPQRRAVWDAFVDGLPAEVIHFADDPALAGFQCPDGDHLDQRDKAAFTRALLKRIGKRPAAATAPDGG